MEVTTPSPTKGKCLPTASRARNGHFLAHCFRTRTLAGTAALKFAINQIVDKRFDKRQSMRWTPRGAHLLLQTRTRVLNDDLDQVIRRCYPALRIYHRATDIAPVL